MYNPALMDHLVSAADDTPAFGEREAICHVDLGMPHLASAGLSENWLQKELGHIHWRMLARACGRATPDFRDERGAPVYAAFCALSIRDGDFASARDHDSLAIRSRIARLTRTQIGSCHRLEISGRAIGRVDMISTFIRREGRGNHSVARYPVAGLPPVDTSGAGARLAELAALARADRLEKHMGFALPAAASPLASVTFSPCPSADFNGAGFLYFASFSAFVDRAEWQFDRTLSRDATTVHRDIFFFGNLDPGEDLRIDLHEFIRAGDGQFRHLMTLTSEETGKVIGQVFSERIIPSP